MTTLSTLPARSARACSAASDQSAHPGGQHVLQAGAVARQEGHGDGVARGVKRLGQGTHRRGITREAVEHEGAVAVGPLGKPGLGSGKNRVGHQSVPSWVRDCWLAAERSYRFYVGVKRAVGLFPPVLGGALPFGIVVDAIHGAGR